MEYDVLINNDLLFTERVENAFQIYRINAGPTIWPDTVKGFQVKKTHTFLFCLAVASCCGMSGMADAQIAITSVEMLQRIGQDPEYPLNGSYILTQDIDASETRLWNNGAGFLPVGAWVEDNDAAGFSGSFDGQGFVIRGLFIHRPDEQGIGLFRSIASSGVVVNLGIDGGSITGSHYVGSLVGENWSDSVAACFSTAAVSGISRVGCLAGINRGILDACYATGPVSGDFFVGGLAGRNYKGTVQECYAAGRVSGYTWVGGLIGESFEAEAVACFWDTTTSMITFSGGGTGQPTEALLRRESYLAAGWDFEVIWDIAENRGYPRLKSLW